MKQLQELLDLKNKAAIVTGGAKGIGYGIAYRLAEAGAKVLVADLDEETAVKTAQELAGPPRRSRWTCPAKKTSSG
jgi:NAD(P)-dependent dehydrogenase (short-subunit alcohol dehydrogenase family)